MMKTWIAIAAVGAQVVFMAPAVWAQAYTRIVSPVQNQCVPGPDVKVQFEAGGITLAQGGYNLHFKLDDEPFQVQYNGNRAHTFRNVMPGTHTVRVYVANALHEVLPETVSTVSFNVAHYDGANYVRPGQPTLLFNLPQGQYLGPDAVDVTVDFAVANATLSPGGYQVAYYADGRRFLVQGPCGPRHLKNLASGLHKIRIELQDHNGDLVPGPFNSGERTILIAPESREMSPWPESDGYNGQSRLDSMPGPMTIGGPRPMPVIARELTPEESEKKRSLTVLSNRQRLDLEGNLITSDNPATASPAAPARDMVEEGEAERTPGEPTGSAGASGRRSRDFEVRQGGLPDDEAPVAKDEDTVHGRTEPPPSDEVNAGKSSASARTSADAADEAPAKAAKSEAAATSRKSDVTSGSIRVRRRADGTTSTVERSTATLHLSDRPNLRQGNEYSTRTVRTMLPRFTSGTLTNNQTSATSIIGGKAAVLHNDKSTTVVGAHESARRHANSPAQPAAAATPATPGEPAASSRGRGRPRRGTINVTPQ